MMGNTMVINKHIGKKTGSLSHCRQDPAAQPSPCSDHRGIQQGLEARRAPFQFLSYHTHSWHSKLYFWVDFDIGKLVAKWQNYMVVVQYYLPQRHTELRRLLWDHWPEEQKTMYISVSMKKCLSFQQPVHKGTFET